MIGIRNKGFTLIELTVSVAVLLFVVVGAVAIFITVVQHQRVILAEQELLNQASFVLERMSKALRTAKREDGTGTVICLFQGYNYELTRPDSGIYTGIKFINQSDNNACQEFYLNTDRSVLMEVKNYGNSVDITSDKFQVNSIRFGINGGNGCHGASCVNGARDSDGIQPRVTIFLEIQTTGSNPIVKKIQTTVSQRDLNVP
ncbi:MAG: prepilin-type N-terminal cleavage/methylation domain-containing protein [Candidatus Staskawiczbacteria bacterium]|nr:prepilin-type N-terminal cleavage/methylation domain-containing protein [Candidatus Staskawiczbacteria bacterium]